MQTELQSFLCGNTLFQWNTGLVNQCVFCCKVSDLELPMFYLRIASELFC